MLNHYILCIRDAKNRVFAEAIFELFCCFRAKKCNLEAKNVNISDKVVHFYAFVYV